MDAAAGVGELSLAPVESCDGEALPALRARRLARLYYYVGFFALPWFWVANCWYFFPDFRHAHDPVVAKCERGRACGRCVRGWALRPRLPGSAMVRITRRVPPRSPSQRPAHLPPSPRPPLFPCRHAALGAGLCGLHMRLPALVPALPDRCARLTKQLQPPPCAIAHPVRSHARPSRRAVRPNLTLAVRRRPNPAPDRRSWREGAGAVGVRCAGHQQIRPVRHRAGRRIAWAAPVPVGNSPGPCRCNLCLTRLKGRQCCQCMLGRVIRKERHSESGSSTPGSNWLSALAQWLAAFKQTHVAAGGSTAAAGGQPMAVPGRPDRSRI